MRLWSRHLLNCFGPAKNCKKDRCQPRIQLLWLQCINHTHHEDRFILFKSVFFFSREMHSGLEQQRIGTEVLTHLLAPHFLLCLSALLHSFICSLAHSLTQELVGKWIVCCHTMTWYCPAVNWGTAKAHFDQKDTASESESYPLIKESNGNLIMKI